MTIIRKVLLVALGAGISANGAHADAAWLAQAISPPLQRVNIIGEDNRGVITELGSKLGLSPAEIEQIRQTTGIVRCRGVGGAKGATGAGYLLTRSLLITNQHVLFDNEKTRIRGNCTFTILSRPQKELSLHFSTSEYAGSEKDYHLGTTKVSVLHSLWEDFAVVRLVSPVLDASPFPIHVGPIKEGEKLLLVSGVAIGFRKSVFGDPIVQACTNHVVEPTKSSSIQKHLSGVMHDDCDVSGGQSGSPYFIRDKAGRLAFAGIVAAAGNSSLNYQEFSILGNLICPL